MNVRAYVSKNLIAIVMVPAIISAHYGWYRLQKVDALVSEQDRKTLPFSRLMFPKE